MAKSLENSVAPWEPCKHRRVRHHQDHKEFHHHYRFITPLQLLIIILLTFPFLTSRHTFKTHGGSQSKIFSPRRTISSLSSPIFQSTRTSTWMVLTTSMLVAVESILVQVSPRSLLGVTIGSDSPDIVVVGADGSGNGGSHPTTSSNSPRKLPKPSLSLPIPSANTFSPISISVGLDPTQSASTSNNAPTATPTSTIGTASQGKTGACNDAVSSPCTYASPVGTNGVDIISSAGALPPGATPSGSDGSVQITSDGLNSSVSSGSPLHPSATVSSNNAPAAVGDPNSDNNNDPRYHPITSVARALVPIAVVVVVGVLVIGAVVLRRKRNRHREGGYDDYLPYHGGKRRNRTDRHVGLNSMSSSGSRVSEPPQQEQFWNP